MYYINRYIIKKRNLYIFSCVAAVNGYQLVAQGNIIFEQYFAVSFISHVFTHFPFFPWESTGTLDQLSLQISFHGLSTIIIKNDGTLQAIISL